MVFITPGRRAHECGGLLEGKRTPNDSDARDMHDFITVNGRGKHALKDRNAQEQGTRDKKTSWLVECRQLRAINYEVAPAYQEVHRQAGRTDICYILGVNDTRYL